FGERTLRDELDLDLTGEKLPLELLVLADVGRNHLPDLTGAQEHPDAEIVDPGVVADDNEVLGAAAVQRGDQVFGNPAQAEAAHHDGRAVGNQGHGLVGAGQNFVHEAFILLVRTCLSPRPGVHTIPMQGNVRYTSPCTQTSRKLSRFTIRLSPRAARRSSATRPRRRSPTSSSCPRFRRPTTRRNSARSTPATCSCAASPASARRSSASFSRR